SARLEKRCLASENVIVVCKFSGLLRPRKLLLWELAQETHVVLKKHLNVVDSVFQHGEAVDADAEGKTADFFRIVIYETVDRGIDHARPKEFDPAGSFALAAGAARFCGAAAAAENAGGVELDGWFGERKIAGAEASFYAFAEELLHKIVDGAGEVAESNVCIDGQTFNLVKHERVRGIRIVSAVDLAGNNNSHGRLAFLHGVNL